MVGKMKGMKMEMKPGQMDMLPKIALDQ